MEQDEKEQYANWLLDQCNEPINEITFLLDNVPQNILDDIRESVLHHL
jgi:hypothetical protein